RAHLTRTSWGYAARASHRIIDVAACLLVEPEVEALAHEVAAQLHRLDARGFADTFGVDVVGTGPDRSRGAVHIAGRKASPSMKRKLQQLLDGRVPNLAGLVVTQGERTETPLVLGEPVLVDRE